MKLDKNALRRLQSYRSDFSHVKTAFAALGSAQDISDYAAFGATGSQSEDGLSYNLTLADTTVTFSLFFVARHKGHVVCTTQHPFDERRRLPLFDFSLDASGMTNLIGESGEECELGNLSHMIGSMALEMAMRSRLTAATSLDSSP